MKVVRALFIGLLLIAITVFIGLQRKEGFQVQAMTVQDTYRWFSTRAELDTAMSTFTGLANFDVEEKWGGFVLKPSAIKDMTRLLAGISQTPTAYSLDAIGDIIKWFPTREAAAAVDAGIVKFVRDDFPTASDDSISQYRGARGLVVVESLGGFLVVPRNILSLATVRSRLLGKGTPVREKDTSPSDPCAAIKDCSKCGIRSGCGWCPNVKQCVSLDVYGLPVSRACSAYTLIKNVENCPVVQQEKTPTPAAATTPSATTTEGCPTKSDAQAMLARLNTCFK